MSDKPLPWPYHAREARDRAAESANHALHLILPLIAGDTLTDNDRLRRLALVANELQTIARLLESVGACTRP